MMQNENIEDEENENCWKVREGDFYDACCEASSSNCDNFEKKITYIAAGAVAIVLAYVNTIDNGVKNKMLIIIGIIFLVISLLMNLISYAIHNVYWENLKERINENLKKDIEPSIKELAEYRMKKINKHVAIYNFITLIFLIIGVIFTTIFFLITYLK